MWQRNPKLVKPESSSLAKPRWFLSFAIATTRTIFAFGKVICNVFVKALADSFVCAENVYSLSYYPLARDWQLQFLITDEKHYIKPRLCNTYNIHLHECMNNNKNIRIQPPSSSIVAPGTPSKLASSEDNTWVRPCKTAPSRPARIDTLDKLHPGI